MNNQVLLLEEQSNPVVDHDREPRTAAVYRRWRADAAIRSRGRGADSSIFCQKVSS